jgi:hypothetical protein
VSLGAEKEVQQEGEEEFKQVEEKAGEMVV